MNMFHHRDSERGQAIVLLVFGMIVLLGMAGLALDGGNVYTQRRRAQSAVDNAALAYALVLSQSGSFIPALQQEAQTKAETVLAYNGYVNGQNTVSVTIIYPAPGLDNSHVEVVMTQTVPTAFIHLVYGGPATYSVRAVARGVAGSYATVANGNAIVAMDSSDCSTLNVTGGASVQTSGGGIFVNSSAHASNCHAAVATGGGTVNGGPDGINVVGDTSTSGGASFVPPLTQYPNVAAITDPLASVPPPTSPAVSPDPCAGTAINHQGDGLADVINPGHYSQIKRTGGNLTMNPGIYCIESPQVNQGVSGSGSSAFTGNGVLIYLKSGSFSMSGSAAVNLSAPTAATCTSVPVTCDYVGMLIYSDRNNSNSNTDIVMTGGSGTTFTGTIYALNNDCIVTGNAASIGLYSQLICKTVTATGTGTFNVTYDPNQNFRPYTPPSIALIK